MRISMIAKIAAGCSILISMTTLTGCSMLSPVKVNEGRTYVLDTLPQPGPRHQMHAATILVLAPETNPAYNTTSMAYTEYPYQLAYFSQNRWAETPAQMLQPLIVQALQDTHYFHAVVSAPYYGKYTYGLRTEILELQQDFTHKPTLLVMTVRAQITWLSNGQIIATRQFTVRRPIYQKTPYSGVVAANSATAEILHDLAVFSMEKTGR